MTELHLGVYYNGQANNLIYSPGTMIDFYGTYLPGKTINIYLDGVVRTHITAVQVNNTGYFSVSAPLPNVSVGQTYTIRACNAGSLGIYECALFPDQSVETINLIVSEAGTGTGTLTPCSYGNQVQKGLFQDCPSGYIQGSTNIFDPASNTCVCESTEEGQKIKKAVAEPTDWKTYGLIAVGILALAYILGGKR